jgi:hypothetical protein
MCLLVNQPASTVFTEDFIKDVYSRNSDGFGVMYAEHGKVHVYKCLPTSGDDMYAFYQAHAEGRDCVWHARMQTHGDIDLDNCHPYRVTDDIWLAHNGILSTSNAADKTKSDTWHFIRNIIAPALTGNPDLMLDESWQKMIGSIIGNGNKFGLVRADGETVIINQQSGVNFVGAWLSNTYAWSTTKFGFRQTYQSSYSGQSGYSNMHTGYGGSRSSYWEDEDQGTAYTEWWHGQKDNNWYNNGSVITKAKGEVVKEKETAQVVDPSEVVQYSPQEIRPMIRAAFNCWMRNGRSGIEQWCKQVPYKAAAVIGYWYDDLPHDELENMVEQDPEEAAVWIEDLFRTDSIQPSMIS